MGTQRLTRVNELLKREIAGVLFRVMNEQAFDLSAVTVTRVDTSSNLRQAQVFVSIRGEEPEQRKMLGLLKKHRGQIQRMVSKSVVLKYTPHLYFHLDESVHGGDRILELLDGLVPAEDAGEAEEEQGGTESGEARDE